MYHYDFGQYFQAFGITFEFNAMKVISPIRKEVPMFDFLLVFNRDVWPNSASLRDINLPYDLDFDKLRTFKVKYNNIG